MEKTIVTSLRIKEEILHEAKEKALKLKMKLGAFIESAILHEIMRQRGRQ